MRKEIYKTIKSLCDEIGTEAAYSQAEKITSDLEREYDERVKAGMSELDAYRDVLRGIEKIEEMLKSMPKTDDEAARENRKADLKRLKRTLGSISSWMWIITVIVYVLFSFKFGYWHLSWLIFLYSSILQNIINMVSKYNSGKSLRRTLKSGLSSILWLLTVILYFLISFTLGGWNVTWVIFLIGTLIQKIINSATQE